MNTSTSFTAVLRRSYSTTPRVEAIHTSDSSCMPKCSRRRTKQLGSRDRLIRAGPGRIRYRQKRAVLSHSANSCSRAPFKAAEQDAGVTARHYVHYTVHCKHKVWVNSEIPEALLERWGSPAHRLQKCTHSMREQASIKSTLVSESWKRHLVCQRLTNEGRGIFAHLLFFAMNSNWASIRCHRILRISSMPLPHVWRVDNSRNVFFPTLILHNQQNIRIRSGWQSAKLTSKCEWIAILAASACALALHICAVVYGYDAFIRSGPRVGVQGWTGLANNTFNTESIALTILREHTYGAIISFSLGCMIQKVRSGRCYCCFRNSVDVGVDRGRLCRSLEAAAVVRSCANAGRYRIVCWCTCSILTVHIHQYPHIGTGGSAERDECIRFYRAVHT